MLGTPAGQAQLPLATAGVIGLCVAVQAFVFLFDPPLTDFTVSAALVLYAHQYYRIITSAYFHGGIMHIAMNMMSMMSMGASLERSIGTVQLVLTVLWQTLLTGSFSVGVCWILSMVLLDDMSYLKQQSVGFSGVLFALAVVDIHKSPVPTRSVMGFFTVPAKWYPWILLVLLQVLIPNVSFIGHLSGILLGTWQTYGGLALLLPSQAFTREIETWPRLNFMTDHARFVTCPDGACENALTTSDLRRLGSDTLAGIQALLRMAFHILEAVLGAVLPRQNRHSHGLQDSTGTERQGAGITV